MKYCIKNFILEYHLSVILLTYCIQVSTRLVWNENQIWLESIITNPYKILEISGNLKNLTTESSFYS